MARRPMYISISLRRINTTGEIIDLPPYQTPDMSIVGSATRCTRDQLLSEAIWMDTMGLILRQIVV
jgi:hypothetical protein